MRGQQRPDTCMSVRTEAAGESPGKNGLAKIDRQQFEWCVSFWVNLPKNEGGGLAWPQSGVDDLRLLLPSVFAARPIDKLCFVVQHIVLFIILTALKSFLYGCFTTLLLHGCIYEA